MSDLSEPFVENVVVSVSNPSTSNSTINKVHLELNSKTKAKLDDNHEGPGVQPSSRYDSKLDTAVTLIQYHEPSEIGRANLAAASTTEASNTTKDMRRSCGLVKVGKNRAYDKSADNHHDSMQDSGGGSEDSLEAKKGSTGFGSQSVDEQWKCIATFQSLPTAMGECNVIASVGSPSLASSVDISVTKSPPANHMNVTSQSQDIDSKVKGTSECNFTSGKHKSGTLSEGIKNEENHEKQKKFEKELAKPSASSSSKSVCKKVLHASVSKRTSSDSKEGMLCSTLKSPPSSNVSATSGSEPSTVLHAEGASNLQKKECISQTEVATTVQKKVAVLPQKSEKISQSVSQSSAKVSASLPHTAASSSSPATLSDEEASAS